MDLAKSSSLPQRCCSCEEGGLIVEPTAAIRFA